MPCMHATFKNMCVHDRVQIMVKVSCSCFPSLRTLTAQASPEIQEASTNKLSTIGISSLPQRKQLDADLSAHWYYISSNVQHVVYCPSGHHWPLFHEWKPIHPNVCCKRLQLCCVAKVSGRKLLCFPCGDWLHSETECRTWRLSRFEGRVPKIVKCMVPYMA